MQEDILCFCKFAVRWCIRKALKICFILPVKKDRILFSSYSGEAYACNPKYISEYLCSHYPGRFELIWAFQRPEAFANLKGIKPVKYYSVKRLIYAMTAGILVSNCGQGSFLPKRKEQLWIETWHGGGGYKKEAFREGNSEGRIRRWYLKHNLGDSSLFLSSCRHFTENNLYQNFHFAGEVLESGLPRNDLLLDRERKEKVAEYVRKKLGINGYVVIYAPTFRGEKSMGYRTDMGFPYAEVISALEKKTGKSVTILKRAHPSCVMADRMLKQVLDVTEYPDMQELLCAVDLLITDYSSCMWDHALSGKPCLLFIPDLEEYERNQGIYGSVEKWPGIPCRNAEELLNAIKGMDEERCAELAREHLKFFGSYEKGTATQQVCERIVRYAENGKEILGRS